MEFQDLGLEPTGGPLPHEREAKKEAWRITIPAGEDYQKGDAPAAIPIGWFVIARSSEIDVGAVRAVRCFSKDLVLWRGEDGRARLLDARCPHNNRTDMANGGKVAGNWLQCPLHHWRWDEAGTLKDIPYSQVPVRAGQRECAPKWPLRETGNLIWAWNHPDRGEPSWEPAA